MAHQKNRRHPIKQGSLAAEILLEIGKAAGDILTFGYNPRGVIKYGFDGMQKIYAAKEARRLRRELKRLKERKLIKIRETGRGLEVALTEQGKLESVRQKVLRCDLFEDGSMCMVVFDIPESQRVGRKLLREFLSRAGFAPLQRSVWISPFDAERELRELFNREKLSKWIRIFTIYERDPRKVRSAL